MARIAEKNLRFREKSEMIADLSKILQMDIHYGTKYAVLDEIAWVWTEFYGKYIGCPYWSEEALKKFEDEEITKVDVCNKVFRHEHSVPRKVILKHLLNINEVNEEYIHKIFENTLVGVVLTKDEDAELSNNLKDKMPNYLASKELDKYDEVDKWARYKEKGILIYKVEWENRKIKSKELIMY